MSSRDAAKGSEPAASERENRAGGLLHVLSISPGRRYNIYIYYGFVDCLSSTVNGQAGRR